MGDAQSFNFAPKFPQMGSSPKFHIFGEKFSDRLKIEGQSPVSVCHNALKWVNNGTYSMPCDVTLRVTCSPMTSIS